MDKLSFATIGVSINDKGKADEIATPIHICNDMTELFPSESFNDTSKIWADIYCKTGNTLKALKQHGVPKENIAAICPTPQSQLFACRQLYGKLLPEVKIDKQNKYPDVAGVFNITRRGQVYYISNWKEIVTGKVSNTNALTIINKIILNEMRSEMSLEFTSENGFKFNNIIMNPPYNNDMYLDFVTLAHKLATDNVVAITPAKWQAKGGAKNEQFRKDIVPYMKEIVYYPYTKDIFDVTVGGGITYYLIDNSNDRENEEKTLEIKNIDKQVIFKNETINISQNRRTYFNDIYENIVNKMIKGNEQLTVGNYKNAPYYVEVSHLSADKDKSNCMGGLITTPFYKSTTVSCVQNIHTIFSGTENECDSFISYVNTKTIRFLIMLRLYVPVTNNIAWSFVPAPEAFDHIFTDQELYEKYQLTDEEINIIESVIKERK